MAEQHAYPSKKKTNTKVQEDEYFTDKEIIKPASENANWSWNEISTGVIISLVMASTPYLFSCLLGQRFSGQSLESNADIRQMEINGSDVQYTRSWSKYALYGETLDDAFSIRVQRALMRLSVTQSTKVTAGDWDLLWATDYPFATLNLQKIKSYQLVNHFPGSQCITDKLELCAAKLRYFPLTFKLPDDEDDFVDYMHAEPEKKFVQRENGRHPTSVRDLDKTLRGSSRPIIVQEFIDNPLLVDGHAFEIGIFTVITSIDPLRLYIFQGDALFRYSLHKFHRIAPDELDEFLANSRRLAAWEMPALREYFATADARMKHSFDSYMRSSGLEPSPIWEQMEDAIRQTVLAKEPQLISTLRNHGSSSTRNFFELMRFDFIVDSNLQAYLLDAKASPFVEHDDNHPQHWPLIEEVLHGALSLVGVGSQFERDPSKMNISEIIPVVEASQCSKQLCVDSCTPEECRLCATCMDQDELHSIYAAQQEHVNRGDMKRIFPPTNTRPRFFNLNRVSARNQLMVRWYDEKCNIDKSYCE